MNYNKHIAFWSCPRSCSTLLARSFEQRKDCIVFDEPLYGAYLLRRGFDHPFRKEIMQYRETDYRKVIQNLTGNLPEGIQFSYQKHIAKAMLPEYSLDWLDKLHNVFLIREPKSVIASYAKVMKHADRESIGFDALYRIYNEVKNRTGSTPLVVDATDILQNPEGMLNMLCSVLGIPFDKKMLSWEAGLENSDLLMGKELAGLNNPFFSSVAASTGFRVYEAKEIQLHPSYCDLETHCLEIYEELYAQRTIVGIQTTSSRGFGN